MAYLHWGVSPRTPVTGVTPFTYRDNATYLSKLEDLWDRHHEVNTALTDAPELINQDPYAAWIIEVRPTDAGEYDQLLTAAAYLDLLRG